MKRNLAYILSACVLVALSASCARTVSSYNYADAKRYLEAWMSMNHPDVQMREDGLYVLDEVVGTGEEVGDKDYVFVTYTVRSISGNIEKTTDPELMKQLGKYEKATYYGDHVWKLADNNQLAGVEYALRDMKVGGTRTVVIPRWLLTGNRHESLNGYLDDTKGASVDYIYELKVADATDSLERWQIDTMDRYIAANYDASQIKKSSRGFRYIRTKEPSDTTAYKKDSTFYINYTGRLLNGQVFDTTDPDLAKIYNVYSSDRTYGPVKIKMGEKYSDITLSGSNTISGFALTLWNMRPNEKGVGIFYSNYGYGASGSGDKIPEYAPLIFEIEIVDDSND